MNHKAGASPLRCIHNNINISRAFSWAMAQQASAGCNLLIPCGEYTCFCLRHIYTSVGSYHQKLSWHLRLCLLHIWLCVFCIQAQLHWILGKQVNFPQKCQGKVNLQAWTRIDEPRGGVANTLEYEGNNYHFSTNSILLYIQTHRIQTHLCGLRAVSCCSCSI